MREKLKTADISKEYFDYVNEAKDSIVHGDLESAKQLLIKAIAENIECPIAYNLFGAFYERTLDRERANKFYRIAYYFDQTYGPAKNNLERLAQKNYTNEISNIDTGEGIDYESNQKA